MIPAIPSTSCGLHTYTYLPGGKRASMTTSYVCPTEVNIGPRPQLAQVSGRGDAFELHVVRHPARLDEPDRIARLGVDPYRVERNAVRHPLHHLHHDHARVRRGR